MRRITLFVTFCVTLLVTTSVFAQPRTLGARRLVIDNGAGNRVYIDADAGSTSGASVSLIAGYLPSACAILDLDANTSGTQKLGFLGPRVSEFDKLNNMCAAPPDGLLIYNTTFSQYEYYHLPSGMWVPIVSGWAITGNTNLTVDGISNILGSRNSAPEKRVNIAVDEGIVMRFQGDDAVDGGITAAGITPNIIGGWNGAIGAVGGNQIAFGVQGSTIAGGGNSQCELGFHRIR
jgi:hypothetical protein